MSMAYQSQQLNLLREAGQVREAVAEAGYHADSTSVLEEVREEQPDGFTGLR